MAKKNTTYKDALAEIENIVEDIENGSIGIDEISDKVKRAIVLLSDCKEILKNTETNIGKALDNLEP